MYFNIRYLGKLSGPMNELSDPWCSRQASLSDQSSTVFLFNEIIGLDKQKNSV